jgi:ketosteroid isomerase-like protein
MEFTRAMADDSNQVLRNANEQLWRSVLAAQCGRDKRGLLDLLAEGVIFEAPAYSSRREGRVALAAMFDGMLEHFSKIHYEILRVIQSLDPEMVIAEVRDDNVVAETGKPYRNRYLFLVTCQGGRVTEIVEYSNPDILNEAATVKVSNG